MPSVKDALRETKQKKSVVLRPNHIKGIPPPHNHKMSIIERSKYFGKPIVVVPPPAENAQTE